MKVSETNFFDILTIHNDQISYVQDFLESVYMFSPHLGVWRGLGYPKTGAQPA